ncbi:FtsX-like permease family protein [Aureimonas glaciei]|uniref:ABC transporter permease n=1 Tax=Aureimonas glaciei TaxID=1776957 RepID=A0A916Y7F1_9HYPH|nr:FtsX-like permease family protein [Aureimonas glaciei]GGD33449.1 ABC transporter permease [Aureimonas glaciei]
MAAEPDLFSARLALRWLILGEARAHPARFLGTVIAIAVGVALGFAVHLVNGSALASFDGAMRSVNGAADLSVRAASPLGFDENLYAKVIAAEGVADASPVVSLEARAGGAAFTLLGLDVIRAAAVTPSLVGQRTSGADTGSAGLFDGSALFLSRAALEATGAEIGADLPVSARGRTATLRIAGVLAGVPAGEAIGVMDIAAAQWRFDRLGRLDRLDLKLSDAAAARAALAPLLPAEASLASTETAAAQGSALSRAYRVNLDMLALVALITGGFLVFSAQSLSVARRLRAFALVRTLGLPRRGIVAVVALEGLVIGIAGALAGLAAGYGMAVLALKFFGGDLGAGYFRGGDVAVVFQPGAAALFGALGVAAALLGSVLPALAASKAAPAAALKNSGDMLDPRQPVPWKPAVLLMAAGGLASLSPPIGNLPILGFAGMALILAGGVAGVPWLARKLLGPLARREGGGVALPLAVRHVHGAPGSAATALCGIVASTALMIAMATMVTSFRGAVDEWLVDVLSADVYLRAESGEGFGPDAQARLTAVPGAAAIAFSRQIPLTLAPDRPPVTLIARPVDPAALVLIAGAEAPAAAAPASGEPTPVYVSEPAARLYDWQPGDVIALPLGAGEEFRVAGVWRDYARQQGAIVIDEADYQRLTGDTARGEAAVTLAPGADAGATGQALLAALPEDVRPGVSLAEPATLRRFALDLFDKSFAVTYVLEAVAILVGLAGVAATMSSQTLARVREFGMLRHLGLGKRQIMAMLGIEGALLGAVGGLAGTGLGLVLSQVLIHVINPQSFNWTMTTRLPLGTILAVVAALVLAAAGTAILAGRRANAMSAVLAVREDW